MQLTQETNKILLPPSKIEEMIVEENKFIEDLLSHMCLPSRNDDENDFEHETRDTQRIPKALNAKSRAKSLTELQDRLQAISKKSKPTYKDKMLKKGMKKRLNKKIKKNERNKKPKLEQIEKISVKTEGNEKPAKPVFNSEGKMVFSKFDFSDIGKKEHKKQIKDPKKLLENIEKQNEKINSLKESGEIDKAILIKEKAAWKNAIAKTSGEKVKDDPKLLRKTIKRKEQQHKSSKKKWENRQEAVQKGKDERQKKRQENIDKRKKAKKMTKMKKAVKKGKIIPGF